MAARNSIKNSHPLVPMPLCMCLSVNCGEINLILFYYYCHGNAREAAMCVFPAFQIEAGNLMFE